MTAAELLDAAHRFPFRRLRERLKDLPFIVIAPHPDDESLACGGLIAEACREGLKRKVVIVSDGAGSHPNSKAYPPDRLRALREAEARRAGVGAWAGTGGDSLPRPCGPLRSSRRRRGGARNWQDRRLRQANRREIPIRQLASRSSLRPRGVLSNRT